MKCGIGINDAELIISPTSVILGRINFPFFTAPIYGFPSPRLKGRGDVYKRQGLPVGSAIRVLQGELAGVQGELIEVAGGQPVSYTHLPRIMGILKLRSLCRWVRWEP